MRFQTGFSSPPFTQYSASSSVNQEGGVDLWPQVGMVRFESLTEPPPHELVCRPLPGFMAARQTTITQHQSRQRKWKQLTHYVSGRKSIKGLPASVVSLLPFLHSCFPLACFLLVSTFLLFTLWGHDKTVRHFRDTLRHVWRTHALTYTYK